MTMSQAECTSYVRKLSQTVKRVTTVRLNAAVRLSVVNQVRTQEYLVDVEGQPPEWDNGILVHPGISLPYARHNLGDLACVVNLVQDNWPRLRVIIDPVTFTASQRRQLQRLISRPALLA